MDRPQRRQGGHEPAVIHAALLDHHSEELQAALDELANRNASLATS